MPMCLNPFGIREAFGLVVGGFLALIVVLIPSESGKHSDISLGMKMPWSRLNPFGIREAFGHFREEVVKDLKVLIPSESGKHSDQKAR